MNALQWINTRNYCIGEAERLGAPPSASTSAMLTLLDRRGEFELHVNDDLTNGVNVDEISEMPPLHLCTGAFLRSFNAFNSSHQVLPNVLADKPPRAAE
jgi:hypothetical protein